MAHFNFVISQNAKWGHAGFYTDCHRMTVPENILLQKSTGYTLKKTQDRPYAYCLFTYLHNTRGVNMTEGIVLATSQRLQLITVHCAMRAMMSPYSVSPAAFWPTNVCI